MPVMSTSTTVVTCAAVSSEWRMCRAITLRMVENRYSSSPPRARPAAGLPARRAGTGGGAAAPAAAGGGAAAGAGAGAARVPGDGAKCGTSCTSGRLARPGAALRPIR